MQICRNGIEVPRAVTAEKNRLRKKILHRKPKRIKLNRTKVISSDFSNRDQVLYNLRFDKHLFRDKGRVNEGKEVLPEEITGIREPLPTVTQ